jgi:uncharacterized damage-inducible protein DinB
MMIDARYVQVMASYNHWRNENLHAVADRLTDEKRKRPGGAFFGSVQAMLNHGRRLAGRLPGAGKTA